MTIGSRGSMSPYNLPSPWLTVPIFFGLFFGGGYLGIQVSHILAPDSGLAEFVSFLTLPAAFVIGIVAWAGAAIPSAVRKFVRLTLKGDRAPSVMEKGSKATIPPGSSAFVPAALVTCLVAGAVMGAISTRLSFGWVFCLYAGLGLGYGVVCWRLARTGYLPFPRE
jgi:hypothetical protein